MRRGRASCPSAYDMNATEEVAETDEARNDEILVGKVGLWCARYDERDYANSKCGERMAIKQDQYTVIDDTRREAAAIKPRAGMGMNERLQEHKTVCRRLLALLAVSHSEELTQTFWMGLQAVASLYLSTERPLRIASPGT